MRLRWTTPRRQRSLYNRWLHSVGYIQEDNPAAAADVAQAIYDGCDGLNRFPHRGRTGRTDGTRELFFPGLPYIVVYRVKDQVVEIARIYHGAQNWP